MQNQARQLLAEFRCGQALENTEQGKAFLLALQTLPAFAKLASKSALEIRMQTVGNRRMRMLCLCKGEIAVPIPLAKLSIKKELTEKQLQACHKNACLAIMRALIQPQIEAYKASYKDKLAFLLANNMQEAARKLLLCPLSGKPLANGQVHCDHIYPFSRLVADWLAENSLSFEQIVIRKKNFVDEKLAESWADYHLAKACLQMTSAKANLRKGNRCQ